MAGVARVRESWRGVSRTAKVRVKDGSIGMLGRRQVTPRWSDDPMWKHDGRWWRGCQGKRGLPPSEVHRTAGREVRGFNNKYITISDGS